MKNKQIRLPQLLLGAILFFSSYAVMADKRDPVGITPKIMSVTIKVDGNEVEVKRNQDNDNIINPAFSKTSRACPPFCIQPMKLGNGVETIGEVEVVEYIQKMSKGDQSIMLVDSRTPVWLVRGTIPGAINVSWIDLVPAKGATTEGIVSILTKKFGVQLTKDTDIDDVDEAIVEGKAKTVFDYSKAKTLVMFCNGMWCGQSPESIKSLVKYGYPVEKIKYFRGGMQTWELLGFSTFKKPQVKK
jgi:rhodanese-related sulfurtransferase